LRHRLPSPLHRPGRGPRTGQPQPGRSQP
jgi:hypothetical protein